MLQLFVALFLQCLWRLLLHSQWWLSLPWPKKNPQKSNIPRSRVTRCPSRKSLKTLDRKRWTKPWFLTNGRIHPSGLIDSWAKDPSKRIILITTPSMRYYHRKWFNAPITNLVIATVYYEYTAVVNPAIAMLQWVLPGQLGCSLCWPSTRSISHGSLRTRMETDFQSHLSLANAEKRWETMWKKYKHVRTYWDHLKVGGNINSTYTSKHKINGS